MFVFDLDDIPATCHNRVAFGRPSGAPAPGSASHRDIARWPTDMDHPRSFCVGLATLAALLGLPRVAAPASPVPPMNHVVVVVMENHSYDQTRVTPYVANLIAQSASFSNAWAITHPSQPNYLALWAGSTLGVNDDNCPAGGSPFQVENFGHACEQAGLTWKAYSENLPAAGSPICTTPDGLYARKHDPWTQFGNLNHLNEVPYTNLAADLAAGALPNLVFVVPNLCDDTHNCAVGVGDTWLSNNLPAMISAVGPRGMVVLTWDESERSGHNHILTVFAGPLVKSGYVATRRIDHYTVARTVCDALGLPSFGSALSDSSVSDVWNDQPVTAVPAGRAPRVHLGEPTPNPFRTGTMAALELPSEMPVRASVLDCSGRRVRLLFVERRGGTVGVLWDGTQDNGKKAGAGLYFLRVQAGQTVLVRKLTLMR